MACQAAAQPNRFAHLNTDRPLQLAAAALPAPKAAAPTLQALAAQILSAGKPRAPSELCTEAEKAAAAILATHARMRDTKGRQA